MPPASVDLHEDLTIFDLTFLERKKVCLLGFDRRSKKAVLMMVWSHRKIKKMELS
jgi:hypothetical protein